MSHTPGPWAFESADATSINSEFTLKIYAVDPGPTNDFRIAYVVDPDKLTRVANAYLIAAAPELLEALRETERGLRILSYGYPEGHPMLITLENARAAIAKATGGAE